MTDAELWAAWRFWMAVAAVVIARGGGAARDHLAHGAQHRRPRAARARRGGGDPRQHAAIWALQTTNEVAEEMLDTVRAIETKAAALVEALESHAGAGGRRLGGTR